MNTRRSRRWIAAAGVTIALASPASAQDASSFFDDSTMHELRLLAHSDDWKRLQATFLENTYYPADIDWNGIRARNVGIRSRGNGSRNDTKPGLRVDIDRYVSDQRFLGLKSFVLDNVTQDDSLIKERVAMRLFDRLGLVTPREAHVRLYVNNQFFGVYVIVESVDKDLIARTMQPQSTGTTGNQIERNGVLFEYKWHYPFYFSYLGPDLQQYSELFEPKTHELDPPDTLYGPLENLCRLITESSDADFMDVVGAYLDLRQWVRYVAAENFVAENDGMLGGWGVNNFYLYRLERTTVSRVIAWDKDNAFFRADLPIWSGTMDNVLMRRAMAVPELRALYLGTLSEAAQLAATPPAAEEGRGWLEFEIDRAALQIQDWVRLDRAKPQSNEAFDTEVERLRVFARMRSAFVECQVSNALTTDDQLRECLLPSDAVPAATR
jgi:spore coat protein CotH